jgi:hypothetical protein
MLLSALLLVLFLTHLTAFAVLLVRRRQTYYVALVVTFALLSAAMAVRLFVPGFQPVAGIGLDQALRVAAWVAAAVSITWTLLRLRARRIRSYPTRR